MLSIIEGISEANCVAQARTSSIFPMPSADEECAVVIRYRGRDFEITFLPDEDSTNPLDTDHVVPFPPASVTAWEKGEWWFYNMLVHAVDSDGEWLEICDTDSGRSIARLPSFMDQNQFAYALCDELCDELDAREIIGTQVGTDGVLAIQTIAPMSIGFDAQGCL